MYQYFFKNGAKLAFSIVITVALAVGGVRAWTGLTASDGDKLDYAKWNTLVGTTPAAMPSGAVFAFNLAACPSGWSAYAPAVGRTIIGVGSGAGSNTTLGNTGGDKNAQSLAGASVTTNIQVDTVTSGGTPVAADGSKLTSTPASPAINLSAAIYLPAATAFSAPVSLGGVTSSISGGGTATDNMQPYAALLYCQKN